jgi:glycosyltransferase involved in cell wall biosynthesis
VKICILCFDLSNNSLGRAGLLAIALGSQYEVEIIGPSRLGDIWFPMKGMGLSISSYPWKRYPFFFKTIRNMVNNIDADIMIACKLRPTSYGIALIKKWISGIPIILDIDDWELGFFYHSGFWGKIGRFLNFSNPNGLPYSWLMERLTGFADSKIVGNRFIQKKFSGTIIYHCRDTSFLDPKNFDADDNKEKLGLQGKRVVMFLGTPRPHKGTEELFVAMENIYDPDIILVLIGADSSVQSNIAKMKNNQDKVIVFPKIPFNKLPDHLSAADILVIPQKDTTDTIGQIPAKLFDAMAMAKPIITTPIADIPEVLGGHGYLIEPGNPKQIAKTIQDIFSNPQDAQMKGENARKRCQELYDIKVIKKELTLLIEKLTINRP